LRGIVVFFIYIYKVKKTKIPLIWRENHKWEEEKEGEGEEEGDKGINKEKSWEIDDKRIKC
jgi:hypothetical protein